MDWRKKLEELERRVMFPQRNADEILAQQNAEFDSKRRASAKASKADAKRRAEIRAAIKNQHAKEGESGFDYRFGPDSMRPEYLKMKKTPQSVLMAQARSDPQYKEWLARAEDAFFRRPSLVDHKGDLITPAEWLEFNEQEKQDIFAVLTGQPVPEDREADARKRADFILDALKTQSFDQNQLEKYAATQESIDARTGEMPVPMLDERYVTSEELGDALEATRALNLLSTFETGPFQPEWASLSGGLLGRAGIPGGMLAGLFTDTPGLEDTIQLAGDRNITSITNPASARINESLYWDRRAEEGSRNNLYKTSGTGAYYPQFSNTTIGGLGVNNDIDNANLYTQLSKGIQTVLSGETAPAEVFGNLRRVAPRLPASVAGDTENLRRLAKGVNTAAKEYEQKYVDEYPVYVDMWNKTFGTNYPLRFPTPLENTVVNAPKYIVGDPPEALGFAAGIPAGLRAIPRILRYGKLASPAKAATAVATDIGRKAAPYLKFDAPGELGFSAAVSNGAGEVGFFDNLREGNLKGQDGKAMLPTDPNYRQALLEQQERNRNSVDEVRRLLQNNSQRKPLTSILQGTNTRY